MRIQSQAAARDAAARQKTANTKPRKLSLKERTELDGMEAIILVAEQEAEAIETKLNDAEFQAQHYEEIPELAAKLDAAKAEVARLYQRWEELEALREALEK
jgi:ATP-binding cassette subfamily F protein uup